MLQHLARTCLTRKKRKTIDEETAGWYDGGCWVMGVGKMAERGERDGRHWGAEQVDKSYKYDIMVSKGDK
jgi:hypothetical protein